jgi:hypothetical protein
VCEGKVGSLKVFYQTLQFVKNVTLFKNQLDVPMCRNVKKHLLVHLDGNERIVDSYDVHARLDGGPEHQPAGVAEAVDADLGGKKLRWRRSRNGRSLLKNH